MVFDVKRVRADYPALSDSSNTDTVWLDGAAGTLTPYPVIEAIADAYRIGTSNAGGVFASSHRATEATASARSAVADLVGSAHPEGVILGPNMTTLTYRLANTLAAGWADGDNVVLSRLDHDANVRPWAQAAGRAGAEVRWAQVDIRTGELPADQYEQLVDERTRLVAVTAASNVLGTRPDVRAITDIAHAAGALAYVDGVHASAHGVTDMAAHGADFYATSAYKWVGPHIGCVIADPSILQGMRPDKLASSSDDVPDRFELGTPSFMDYAGVAAAVDYLASLDDSARGDRRSRLIQSLTAAESHEQELLETLLTQVVSDPRVTVWGRPARRTATVFLTVDGYTPEQVARHLAHHEINAWHGHNYAWEVTAALGIRHSGSAVRISLSHYTDESDVQRLLDAMAALR